ncbi:MAG: hypothetical protein ACMG57_04885 [Candidatus Dojkabacteria bacterium]
MNFTDMPSIFDAEEKIDWQTRYIMGLFHTYPRQLPLSITAYRDLNDPEVAKSRFLADTQETIELLTHRWADISLMNLDTLNVKVADLLNQFQIEDNEIRERLVAILIKVGAALSNKYESDGYRKSDVAVE